MSRERPQSKPDVAADALSDDELDDVVGGASAEANYLKSSGASASFKASFSIEEDPRLSFSSGLTRKTS